MLNFLFQLLTGLGNAAIDVETRAAREYAVLRGRILNVMFGLLIAATFAALFNYLGTSFGFPLLRTFNLVAGCVAAIVSAILMLRPEAVLAYLGITYVVDGQKVIVTPVAGGKPIEIELPSIITLGKALAWYFLVLSFFFMVLGTFPIARNWMNIFAAYLAIFVLVLAGPTLKVHLRFAKWIIYWYTILVLVLAVGAMVSGAAYKKTIGFDPFTYLRITAVDVKVDQIQQVRDQNEQREVLKRLDVILKKEKKGEALTQEERSLMKKAESNTIPGKVVNAIFADTEEVELAKDITVIYVPVGENEAISLNDVYDGSGPDDVDNLLYIQDHFKAGQKLLKLAGTRVIDNVKLQEVQIPGPDGKFIGGTILLVDPNDIVAKGGDQEKTAKSTGPGWFSRQGMKISAFGGYIWGSGVQAASDVRGKPAQKATINFEGHKAGEEIDTGLMVKKGDIVKYVNVTAPFSGAGGHRIVQDTTCIADEFGVLRISGDKGSVTVEVTPK